MSGFRYFDVPFVHGKVKEGQVRRATKSTPAPGNRLAPCIPPKESASESKKRKLSMASFKQKQPRKSEDESTISCPSVPLSSSETLSSSTSSRGDTIPPSPNKRARLEGDVLGPQPVPFIAQSPPIDQQPLFSEADSHLSTVDVWDGLEDLMVMETQEPAPTTPLVPLDEFIRSFCASKRTAIALTENLDVDESACEALHEASKRAGEMADALRVFDLVSTKATELPKLTNEMTKTLAASMREFYDLISYVSFWAIVDHAELGPVVQHRAQEMMERGLLHQVYRQVFFSGLLLRIDEECRDLLGELSVVIDRFAHCSPLLDIANGWLEKLSTRTHHSKPNRKDILQCSKCKLYCIYPAHENRITLRPYKGGQDELQCFLCHLETRYGDKEIVNAFKTLESVLMNSLTERGSDFLLDEILLSSALAATNKLLFPNLQ